MKKHYKSHGSIRPMLINFGMVYPKLGELKVTVTNPDGEYVVGRDDVGYFVAWRPFAKPSVEANISNGSVS